MAEDFLGISAHFDIDEVVTGFTTIIDLLEKAGTVSEDTARQMTEALVAMQSNMSNGVSADGLEQLATQLSDIQIKIKETMSSFSEGNGSIDLDGMSQMVETFNQMTADALNAAQEAYQKEKDSLVQVQQAVDAAREARDKLADTGGDEFDKANDAYREACDVLSTQKQRVEELETALKSLKDTQEQINQELQAAGGVTSEMCEQISVALQSAFSSFGDVSAGGLENVNELLGSFKAALASIDGSELSKIGPSFNTLVSEIEEAVRKTSEAYANEGEKARQLAWDSQQLKEALQETVASGGASADEIAKLREEYLATSQAAYEAHDKCELYKSTLDSLREVLKSVQDTTGGVAESIESTGSAWSNAKEAIKEWATGNGKAQEAMGKLKEGLSELPGPLGGVFSGFKKMLSAVKLFIQTPIGRVLGVIVFLLQAFKTWTSKSAEGQQFLAKASAYVGSILESLTDILVKVGGYLYHAFADATGPMNAFANGLVTTLKHAVKSASNLLGGLGDVLRGIGRMFKGEFSEGWDLMKVGGASIGKAFEEAGKGFISALGTVWDGAKGIVQMGGDAISKVWNTNLLSVATDWHNKALASTMLSKEQLEADKGIVDAQREQVYLNGQITELKKEAATATKEELKDITKQLRELTDVKYSELINAQRERVRLIQEQNKLHSPTLKSLTAEKVALLELYKLEHQRVAARRDINRLEEKQESKLEKQEKREKKAQERAAAAAKRKEEREKKADARAEAKAKRDAERQQKRENKQAHAIDKADTAYDQTRAQNVVNRAERQAEWDSKLAEAEIAAERDNSKRLRKQRAQDRRKAAEELEKDRQKEKEEAIKWQKKEWDDLQAKKKERGEKYRAFNFKTDIDQSELDDIDRFYDKLAELKEKELDFNDEKELTDKYQDYYDKRLETERQFDDDISLLKSKRNEAMERDDVDAVDRITRSIIQAEKKKNDELSKLAVSEYKDRPDNAAAYEDLGKVTVGTLTRMINELHNLEEAEEKAGRPVKEVRAEIKRLQEQLIKTAPFVAMESASRTAKEARENLEKAKRELEEVKEGGLVLKFGKDESGKMTIGLLTLEEAEKNLQEASNDNVTAFGEFVDATKKSIEKVDELRSAFEKLGSAIGGEIGNAIGLIGGVIGNATKGYSDILAHAKEADRLKGLGDTKGANMEKAGMWVAAMTTMVQIIGTVQKILPTTDDLYEKYAKRQKEINNMRRAVEEYRLSVLLAQQAENGWFAKSGLTSLTDAYEKHGAVVEAYYAKLYEAQEKYQNKSAGLSKAMPFIAAAAAIVASVVTFGGAAAAGAAILGGTLATSLGTAAGAVGAAVVGSIAGAATAAAQSAVAGITYKNGQVAAKDNLRMRTRHRTFFRGEKTQDLAEWTREHLNAELFDGDGLINLEAAQTILDRYGDKLVGETKETLEDLVKLREQYNEFMKEVEKYVSDLYSPLVDDMTDALFKWLETGTDVLYQFRQNAKDTFASIAKDMVKQMLLTQVFDQYKEDLKKIYAAYAASKDRDTLINGVMLATDSFLNRAETELPIIQDALTQINDQFSERGFDLTKSSDEGSGAYKAAQSFSQEQGNELNGRLTAIQIGQQQGIVQRTQMIELQTLTFGAVVQIGNSFLATSKDISAMRDMQYAGLQRLAEISVFTSVLPAMAENINDMRNDIRTKL